MKKKRLALFAAVPALTLALAPLTAAPDAHASFPSPTCTVVYSIKVTAEDGTPLKGAVVRATLDSVTREANPDEYPLYNYPSEGGLVVGEDRTADSRFARAYDDNVWVPSWGNLPQAEPTNKYRYAEVDLWDVREAIVNYSPNQHSVVIDSYGRNRPDFLGGINRFDNLSQAADALVALQPPLPQEMRDKLRSESQATQDFYTYGEQLWAAPGQDDPVAEAKMRDAAVRMKENSILANGIEFYPYFESISPHDYERAKKAAFAETGAQKSVLVTTGADGIATVSPATNSYATDQSEGMCSTHQNVKWEQVSAPDGYEIASEAVEATSESGLTAGPTDAYGNPDTSYFARKAMVNRKKVPVTPTPTSSTGSGSGSGNGNGSTGSAGGATNGAGSANGTGNARAGAASGSNAGRGGSASAASGTLPYTGATNPAGTALAVITLIAAGCAALIFRRRKTS